MRLFAAATLVAGPLAVPAVAGPGPAALATWQRCVAATENRPRPVRAPAAPRLPATADAVAVWPVPAGEACDSGDRSESTIQQWRASVFVADVTLGAVVESLSQTLPVQEDVMRARFLERTGDRSRVQMRIVRRGIVTVVYDTEHDVTFSRDAAGVATSRSVMTRIDEVIDAGTPTEHLRGAGDDRGFLWRLNSYFRYTAERGGVRIDLESLTLSRGVPVLLRPFAAPVIDRIARESVVRTLEGIRRRFDSASAGLKSRTTTASDASR